VSISVQVIEVSIQYILRRSFTVARRGEGENLEDFVCAPEALLTYLPQPIVHVFASKSFLHLTKSVCATFGNVSGQRLQSAEIGSKAPDDLFAPSSPPFLSL
jgi:hypothetical protein